MTYTQYSSYAPTGLPNAALNYISSNPHSTKGEVVGFPDKFDVYTNKENAGVGGYAVTERHVLSEIVGGVLHLHHRIDVDTTGGFSEPTLSDGGTIQAGSTDLYSSTVTVSSNPGADPFNIFYTARSDQVHDVHINAMQNSIMALEQQVGLQAIVSGAGTGISTLNVVTDFDPQDSVDLTEFTSVLDNGLMLGHLAADLKIGGTNESYMPGYNGTGVTLTIGNDDQSTRNQVTIDADTFRLQTAGATDSVGHKGSYYIGGTTGDLVIITGETRIASQLTVGYQGGAVIDPIVTTIPNNDTGTFYSGAAIRAHGGIWFGSGMSGFGDITFITASGENVDIEGDFETDTITVNQWTNLHGTTTQLDGYMSIEGPSYLQTNNDIRLIEKPGTSPSQASKIGAIDRELMDPSYIARMVTNVGPVKNSVTRTTRPALLESNTGQYGQTNVKTHPLLGTPMYPIIGGWTFTGLVNYSPGSVYDHSNVALLSSDMIAAGIGGIGGVSVGNDHASTNKWAETWAAADAGLPMLGGGKSGWGSYSSGLFNPGDTWIEFEGASAAEGYAYPIYYHEVELGGGETNIATGLNVWFAADNSMTLGSVVGSHYRLFQPGNVPHEHLSSDFSSPTAPLVSLDFSSDAKTDYPNTYFSMLSSPGEPSAAANRYVDIYKELQHEHMSAAPRVNVLDALQKSVEVQWQIAEGLDVDSAAHRAMTGVAYIFACPEGTAFEDTQESERLVLRASPTPYGVASRDTINNSLPIKPGTEVPIGEITASCTVPRGGSANWAHLETTSYRANGYYDSCWVPLVSYKWEQQSDGDGSSNPNPQFAAGSYGPGGLGRCLPFYGTMKRSTEISSADAGFKIYRHDVTLCAHQFWVEHNLGPIRSLADLELSVLLAGYGSQPGGGRNNADSIMTAEWEQSLYKLSQTQYSLDGAIPELYVDSTHQGYISLDANAGNGKHVNISHMCTLLHSDTRFALIGVKGPGDNAGDVETHINQTFLGSRANTTESSSEVLAGYIRVVMKKSR
jgi:hypothetical protein